MAVKVELMFMEFNNIFYSFPIHPSTVKYRAVKLHKTSVVM